MNPPDPAPGSARDHHVPRLRPATREDESAIGELMATSVLELFPRYYNDRQTRSASVHIAHLDTSLIDDGTYFVHEADGEIVACGGWSKRDRLYTGSGDGADDGRLLDPAAEPARVRAMFVRADWTRRGLGRAILDACESAARQAGFGMLALMATLPGVPLYRSFGFVDVEPIVVTMPDGVQINCLAMRRPISSDRSR